jgi:hypothetical protein
MEQLFARLDDLAEAGYDRIINSSSTCLLKVLSIADIEVLHHHL